MTASQEKQANESRKAHRARNPILAIEKIGTEQDVRMGKGVTLQCVARENGKFLVQLETAIGFKFQKSYATKEEARIGWKIAKGMVA